MKQKKKQSDKKRGTKKKGRKTIIPARYACSSNSSSSNSSSSSSVCVLTPPAYRHRHVQRLPLLRHTLRYQHHSHFVFGHQLLLAAAVYLGKKRNHLPTYLPTVPAYVPTTNEGHAHMYLATYSRRAVPNQSPTPSAIHYPPNH